PPWPAWDRIVLGSLVLGQLALAIWGVWPGIVRELTPKEIPVNLGEWSAGAAHAFDVGAWMLLGLLAFAVAASLLDRPTLALFGRLGWVAVNVTPLVLVCLGLVGHALRERSAGYAFAAGLVADAALMGGYALAVVTGGGHMDTGQWVRILQLGSLGAALWGLA